VRVVVYPGSFDPVTYGHVDVIRRARRITEKLIVAVAKSPAKETAFSAQERLDMVREATRGLDGVEVNLFDGLLVEYARQVGAEGIIRGLRALSDFEYEFQMALTNRKLYEPIETIFLMTSESYSYLSSSLIKEIARLGADISSFVPPAACRKMKERFAK